MFIGSILISKTSADWWWEIHDFEVDVASCLACVVNVQWLRFKFGNHFDGIDNEVIMGVEGGKSDKKKNQADLLPALDATS